MAGILDTREGMAVYGSCGGRVGTVDGVRGGWLWLLRDPLAGGEAHAVPLDWVDVITGHVRLIKPCDEVLRRWQSAATLGS
jgi:hypothetical protein